MAQTSHTARAGRPLRVLVGCEFSGVLREALRRMGHDAVSCDLLDTEIPGPHLRCDVREVLGYGWDVGIFFPPCTYLCASGLHWNRRRPERAALTEEALEFVRCLWEAPIERVALENPRGCIPTRLGLKPAQAVQPYEFGDDASKETFLWLRGLPALVPTERVRGRMVRDPRTGKTVERWANQLDSGQNAEPPAADRWMKRSRTYPGIAEAMARQWCGRVMRGQLELSLGGDNPDALSRADARNTPAALPRRETLSQP